MMLFETRARGKLLLTAEYFVLEGATALAIPVRFGQSFRISEGAETGVLHWQSFDADGAMWFEARYALPHFNVLTGNDMRTANSLALIFRAITQQKSGFFQEHQAFSVESRSDFPRNWGLGTSSTLIAALARWAGVAPYPVLFQTFGGSGYDIACAYAEGPLLFNKFDGSPIVRSVHFDPPFADQLYFVFLGHKQNSREGIALFRERREACIGRLEEIEQLTDAFLNAPDLAAFEAAMQQHEQVIGESLGLMPVKQQYFNDYWGAIKSLGAWGGDFVMVGSHRSEAETRSYFQEKGLEVCLPWRDMKGWQD